MSLQIVLTGLSSLTHTSSLRATFIPRQLVEHSPLHMQPHHVKSTDMVIEMMAVKGDPFTVA